MNAFQMLQNSFANNTGQQIAPAQEPQPATIDYRKRAIAQNKQATLNSMSQGAQNGQ